jgi:hypothetical protein
MEPVTYIFRIDAFTPDTLPMGRLAEYMGTLAKLLGYPEHTHFVRLEEGSAKLVHKVDAVDAPKVQARIQGAARGDGPQDALIAKEKLDQLLANDNAVGELMREDGRVVIPFPGRTRPKPLTFPAFRQDGSIDGQVVSIGGRDATAHAIIQAGEISYTGLTMGREVARELAHHLYGAKIRVIGSGRWERRPDGAWKLLDFRVDRFVVLDESPMDQVLRDIREIPDNPLMDRSAYRDVFDLGSDGEALH